MQDEYKNKLTEEEYRVLREGGTEAPFLGKFYTENREGTYVCKACGAELFSSDAKFHSDIEGLRGWPSFDEAIAGAVEYREDDSLGIHRTEALCAKCKSHLGHIFEDNASKTGKHLCINSVCLDLKRNDTNNN